MTVNTPVVFIVFNRPHTTAQVFQQIRLAQPRQLFIIADGPRPERGQAEAEKCATVRSIVEKIDWPCEVYRNYAEVNLGVKDRAITGYNWVFANVEEAIILEDDCLPHPTFFKFCEELLAYYRNDERVVLISGNNFQKGVHRGPYSYYFSVFNHIWGWASWRRAWQYLDLNLEQWPALKQTSWLEEWLNDRQAKRYWSNTFDYIYHNSARWYNWDYPWTFSCWARHGLSVLPNVNLVTNIGFGPDANSKVTTSSLANIPVSPMEFPLYHPQEIAPDWEADKFTQRSVFPDMSWREQLINKLKQTAYRTLYTIKSTSLLLILNLKREFLSILS